MFKSPVWKQVSTLTIVLTLAISATAVQADDPAATPEQIGELIRQLDSDEFATREAAQAKLQQSGKAAIDAVRDAATGESQEAAVRAIDILKRHLRGEDDSLKQAAEAALKEIAASENPIAAGRAENALKAEPPKPDPQADQPNVPFGGPARIIPFGGGGAIRIEARAIAIGGGGHKISVKSVDGNKEIDVEEKDRKVKIIESAEGKIKMKIVNKIGNMEKEEEYEADSADELKKKHPEAHKIYEKYSQGGGGARIEFRALPAIPGPDGAPRIKVLPAPLPRAVPAERIKRLEDARKLLEERLKQAKEEAEGAAPPADAAKQLERVQQQIEDNDAIPAEVKQQIKDALKRLEDAAAEEAKEVKE